ncbi:MAG: prolipoprotein diacylglyceryl transferase [Rhodospirillaceae bacterium]|nr:prolipoprotein diacylglyceryl transferase [Rhodospirillaceae bacterium]
MSSFMLIFPTIDPVAVEIGPLAIRWYALAYIFGIYLGIWRAKLLIQKPPILMVKEQIDDFLIWVLLGIVIGGRLGYVLFYKPNYYLSQPLEIFMTWEGGMSFHGGFLGVAIAIIFFSKKTNIIKWYLMDVVSCVAPIGIFLGRVANFINGELYGRETVSSVPWAMAFPNGGSILRHPSQLYEAILEGLVLFILLNLLSRKQYIRERPGILSAVFCLGYASSRIFVEFFREPDSHLGYLLFNLTMGQCLSGLLMILGLYLLSNSLFKQNPVK